MRIIMTTHTDVKLDSSLDPKEVIQRLVDSNVVKIEVECVRDDVGGHG